MLNMTVQTILMATNGELLCGDKNTVIEAVSIDSKNIKENTLFVPLKGERTDAHLYIEDALCLGAKATLTSDHTSMNSDKAWILVKDTKKALQEIAAFYLRKQHFPVVGITGSVGKTTTRELIATALSAELSVYQTSGNKNSQTGVPLSISEVTSEDIVVLELGISEFGEMKTLSNMLDLDIAVVTNIGTAHIKQLKSKENIYEEKLTITNGIKKGGILLLNGDDPMLSTFKGGKEYETYFYGTGDNCQFQAKNIKILDGITVFDAYCRGEKELVELPLLGEHNVVNAMVALAVAHLRGISISKSADKLKIFSGVKMRQQIHIQNGLTIIDDTYNANPDSMKAGISVLKNYNLNGRKIAILGDMLELGEDEILYHKEIGKVVAEADINILLTKGSLSKYISETAKEKNNELFTKHFDSNADVISYLKDFLSPGDIIFLKGSRGMALDEVVLYIMNRENLLDGL